MTATARLAKQPYDARQRPHDPSRTGQVFSYCTLTQTLTEGALVLEQVEDALVQDPRGRGAQARRQRQQREHLLVLLQDLLELRAALVEVLHPASGGCILRFNTRNEIGYHRNDGSGNIFTKHAKEKE